MLEQVENMLCSLRVVYAGIARKINCFFLLVAYSDTETMVPARALVARIHDLAFG